MIPVYNCAYYLRATLASVLAQIPQEELVQIEVIDDCSTRDDSAAVVAECGEGRVAYFRQPANVGPQANFTTCIQRARGEWVHILHGDDAVAPGFYRAFKAAAEQEAAIGAALCRTTDVDGDGQPIDQSELLAERPGVLPNLIERLAVVNVIRFPSIAVRRRTYERLGGFHPDLFHSADWDMWKRIALAVPVWYEPAPLAIYRLHAQSDTSDLMRTGANIADARHAIEIAHSYLPPPVRDDMTHRARLYHGLYAIELAAQMIERRSWASARAQVVEAFRCTTSAPVVRAAAHLLPQALTELFTRPGAAGGTSPASGRLFS
jgi:glycosyltransferase involved in cell wall biosynthesis